MEPLLPPNSSQVSLGSSLRLEVGVLLQQQVQQQVVVVVVVEEQTCLKLVLGMVME